MLNLMILLAAAGAAPQPIHPEGWIRFDDYPTKAMEAGKEGVSRFELTLSPAGLPIGCRIVASSGTSSLDQTSCALAMKRARFSPARDEAGQPVAAVVVRSAAWFMPGSGRKVGTDVAPDGILQVSRLPGKAERPFVTLRQVIGADGKPESCEVEATSGFPALDALGCKAAGDFAGEVVKGADGRPVRALRVRRIAFTAKTG